MGLYDDDLDAARKSEVFLSAARAQEALGQDAADPPERRLGAAVTALEALLAEHRFLEDCDPQVQQWLSRCRGAARALRADPQARPGWTTFAAEHAGFVAGLAEQEGWVRHELSDRPFKVSFAHPEGWRRTEDKEKVWVSPGEEALARVGVHQRALGFEASMELLAATSVEQLRAEVPGAELGQRQFLKLGTSDAYRIDFRWTSPRQGPLAGWQVYAMHGNVAVTVTALAPAGEAARFGPIAEEILMSFRLDR